MKRAPAQLDARPDALLLPDLVRALIERLGDGDLSCELCDRQLATAAAPSWPLRPSQFGFVGPAHTVEAASGDVAAVRRAALALAPGEVLVVAAAQARGAVFGETLARAAQASGAAGVVIDGWVRDLPLLQDVALPLLARGVMPARADGDDTGRTGVPVKIGGLDIAPGDVIVVDANGLVVMPAGRIGAAYEELEKLLKERTCR